MSTAVAAVPEITDASFESRVQDLHGRLAEVCGGLNVLHAELTGLIGEAFDGGLWELGGIVSPEHWLQWQTGLSASRARSLVAVARRRGELPVCTAAFDAGQLSVDQMVVVACHARTHNDAEIRDFAAAATVSQLSRGLAAFADVTAVDADPIDTVTCGFDADRFTMRASGPATEGQIVRHALRDARDTLFRAGRTHLTDWDALVEVATRSLDSNSSPGRRDSYRTLLHLDTGLDTGLDSAGVRMGAERAWLNAGPAVPDAIWRQITCDGLIQPVWSTAGTPVNLGRTTRTVPDRVRRLILDRDRTCRHPGCGSTHRLEVHHLIHWADGGRTDNTNLAALCPTHHRRHHQGDFTIEGPAPGTPALGATAAAAATALGAPPPAVADRRDGLVFRHRHGCIILPGPTLSPPNNPSTGTPSTGTPPSGVEPSLLQAKPYRHPTGERFQTLWFDLTPPPLQPPSSTN